MNSSLIQLVYGHCTLIPQLIHFTTPIHFSTHPFLQANCQVDYRYVGSGNTECHSSQLAIEARNDLSNGLGCSGGRRDDVLGSGTSTTPVLAAWTIDRLLGGSVRMDCGHQ